MRVDAASCRVASGNRRLNPSVVSTPSLRVAAPIYPPGARPARQAHVMPEGHALRMLATGRTHGGPRSVVAVTAQIHGGPRSVVAVTGWTSRVAADAAERVPPQGSTSAHDGARPSTTAPLPTFRAPPFRSPHIPPQIVLPVIWNDCALRGRSSLACGTSGRARGGVTRRASSFGRGPSGASAVTWRPSNRCRPPMAGTSPRARAPRSPGGSNR